MAARRPRAPRPPDPVALRYRRWLQAWTRVALQTAHARVLRALDRLAARQAAAARADAAEDDAARLIRLAAPGRPTVPEDEIARFAATTDAWSTAQQGSVWAAAGRALPAVWTAEATATLRERWIQRNVTLIRSIPTQYHDQVAAILTDGVARGRRAESMAADIARRFEVAESRAALIARDQVGTLSSEIAVARQAAAGVKEWTWETSDDERVRESHALLDGRRFPIGEPPIVDGAPAYPGTPINCRCTQSPVLPEETAAERATPQRMREASLARRAQLIQHLQSRTALAPLQRLRALAATRRRTR